MGDELSKESGQGEQSLVFTDYTSKSVPQYQGVKIIKQKENIIIKEYSKLTEYSKLKLTLFHNSKHF